MGRPPVLGVLHRNPPESTPNLGKTTKQNKKKTGRNKPRRTQRFSHEAKNFLPIAVGYNRLVNKESRKVEATGYPLWRCPELGKDQSWLIQQFNEITTR